MRTFGSGSAKWTSVCLLSAAIFGCQQLDDSEDNSANPPADTDFDIDDTISGGSLLESGGEGGSDDGGTQVECDPVTNTPCSDIEKCTAVLSGSSIAYACVAETGAQTVGEACTTSLEDGLDGCVAGSVCLGDEAGTCRAHCRTSSDCNAGSCVDDPNHSVPHCAEDCSPLEPSCPGTLQCRRGSDRYSCVDAQDGDDGSPGDPCQLEGDAGCAEGLMCVTGALVPDCTGAGCCVRLCDLTSADTCAAPATCTQALEAPAPGFESVGACFVPA